MESFSNMHDLENRKNELKSEDKERKRPSSTNEKKAQKQRVVGDCFA